jgi:hypothetical protein
MSHHTSRDFNRPVAKIARLVPFNRKDENNHSARIPIRNAIVQMRVPVFHLKRMGDPRKVALSRSSRTSSLLKLSASKIITGWWFGTMEFYDFPYIGKQIIPTDSYFLEG